MNILHIAPYYPSVNAMHAGGVAMGYEIESLKKLGHKVYKLSFVQKKYDLKLFQQEKRESDAGFLLKRNDKFRNMIMHPFMPIESATRVDERFLKKIVEYIDKYEIDYIHAEYTAMLWYVRIKKIRKNIKFVAVLHDVTIQSYYRKYETETNYLKKIAYKIEEVKSSRYEYNNLKKCDEILTFSEKDKRIIKEKYNLDSKTINTYFNLDKIQKKRKIVKRKNDGYYSICFMGQMGRTENHDAAMRLLSIFNKLNIKNKKLYIIGTHPKEILRSKASNNIVITGFVDDIDNFIMENCDVACFPLITGAGIKIKVLECLALGIPVITNNIGAEGIDENGEFIRLAETDQEFIDSIEMNVNRNVDYIEKFDRDFAWEKTEKVLVEIYGKNK